MTGPAVKARLRDGQRVELHALMSEEDAEILRTMMQNPFFEDESPAAENFRFRFFEALSKAIRPQTEACMDFTGRDEIPF